MKCTESHQFLQQHKDMSFENINNTFSDLMHIFNTSNSDDDFAGFNDVPRNNDLNSLFLSDGNDSDFLGF